MASNDTATSEDMPIAAMIRRLFSEAMPVVWQATVDTPTLLWMKICVTKKLGIYSGKPL
jgi:hypothetical protein